MTTQLIGPLTGYTAPTYHVAVDGCLVPQIEIMERSDTGGLFTVSLDSRLSIDVPRDQIDRWMWLLANAMAVAAGYSSHGPNSIKANPFARKVHHLGELPEHTNFENN